MAFYIGLFSIVSLFSYFYTKSKTIDGDVLLIVLVFLVMFIPAALRYGIGTDYFSYVDMFNRINYNYYNIFYRFDPGFIFLSKLVFLLRLDVQWVFIIMSFFTYLFLIISVKKKYFFLIIPFYFLFFYLQSYNVIRSALVISIGYFAYNQFEKKKYFSSILCLTLALLFHVSTLFYLIIFIIARFIHLDKKHFKLLFIPVILLGYLSEVFIPIIINKMSVINVLFLRYEGYLYRLQGNKINMLIGTIPRIFIYFMFMLSLKKGKEKISQLTLLIILLFVDVMFMFGYLIMTRILQMLFIVIAMVLCNIYNSKSKYRKITIMLAICYFFLLFLNDLRRDRGKNVVPYKMIENIEWMYPQNI